MKSFFRYSIASALLLASNPTPAHACSAIACEEGAGFPSTATIPSNVGGVFLQPFVGFTAPNPSTPGLRLAVPGAEPIELATTTVDRSVGVFQRVAVRTGAALPLGATLTLHDAVRCAASPDPDAGVPERHDLRSWTVVEAVPLPTTLGTLVVDVANRTVPTPTSDGSCDAPVATVGATVTLTLSNDAAPWEDVFVYETVVDGGTFLPVVTLSPFNGYGGQSQAFGGSWVGRGTDVVFANCNGLENGVPAGAHTVALRGVLPDGTIVTTPEVPFELSCPGGAVEAGTGTGGTDAGTGGEDAGPAAQDGSGTANCAAAPGASRGADARTLAGLALGLALVARRRVRRSRH